MLILNILLLLLLLLLFIAEKPLLDSHRQLNEEK